MRKSVRMENEWNKVQTVDYNRHLHLIGHGTRACIYHAWCLVSLFPGFVYGKWLFVTR